MGCQLTKPLSEKDKKKYKNFKINLKTFNLVFVNPLVKTFKIVSRKHKRYGKAI